MGYDFTAGLEDELDEVSGGRAQWQAVLESFWKDFKPRTTEVMEQKPSEVTAALDKFLEPYLFPAKADGGDPRLCPNCGEGQLALRGGQVRRVRRLLQLPGVQVHPAASASRAARAIAATPGPKRWARTRKPAPR